MAERELKAILKALKDAFSERGFRVERFILFGSRVCGDAGEQSDYDICVVSEDFNDMDVFERARVVGDVHWQILQRFCVPLDILPMTPEEAERSGGILVSELTKGLSIEVEV
ncbi:MAG TPA: nucleotidyltransferase domain-containing protein [Proteobacteria bacterium]|nr:nucleotidyltransferase domain-containing protein [Pseudomonadota bacterium]